MTESLKMTPEEIAKNAARLNDLAARREAHEKTVEQIVAQMESLWRGEAHGAFKQAADKYLEAAAKLRRDEAEIAAKLATSAQSYAAADDGATASLASSMGI